MSDVIKGMLLKILVEVLGKLITPEVVEEAKVGFVTWLKSQVASTDNEIDDAVVAIIAKALGVPI